MEERITTDPGIFEGKPIIRGLRISVEMVLDLMGQGMTEEEILAEHPLLESADLAACVRCAEGLPVTQENLDILQALGNVYGRRRRYEKAESLCRRLIECEPGEAHLHAGLGLMLHAQRKEEEALAAFDTAIEIEPKTAVGHFWRGFILYGLKRYRGAICSLDRATALDEKSAGSFYWRGSARYALAYDEHERRAQKARKESPSNACVYVPVDGDMKALLEAALEDFAAASRLRPDWVEPIVQEAKTYEFLNRLDEATAAYERALKADSDDADALYALGSAFYRQGRYQEAANHLKRCIDVEPDRIDALEWLGRTYRSLEQHDEARGLYQAALEVKSDYMPFYQGLYGALEHLGRWEEALDVSRRAVELDPHDYTPRVALAGALEALERYEEALRALEEAKRIAPGKARVYVALAGVYRNLGQHERFMETLREGTRAAPGDHWAWCALASVYRQEGRLAEAVDVFREATRATPKDSMAWWMLASACEEAGFYEEAGTAYRESEKTGPRGPGPSLFDALVAKNLDKAGRSDEARELYRQSLDNLREHVRSFEESLAHNSAVDNRLMQHLCEHYAEALQDFVIALVKVGEHEEARGVLEKLRAIDEEKAAKLADLLKDSPE